MNTGRQPQNVEIGSGQPQEVQKNNSVFDFLYHDSRRVASFLSQFDTYGQLLSVKAVETEKLTSIEKGSTKIGGSIKIAQGEASSEESVSDESLDSAEKIYDPLWKNARTFLDYLEDRQMLNKDIWDARIGQFVFATGALAILDIEMFKGMYTGVLSTLLRAGIETGVAAASPPQSRSERRRNGPQKRLPNEPTAEHLLAMIEMMPHTAQLRLFNDRYNVWAMPDPQFLISTPADLILKHGTVLSGEWSVVGVLDAFPDGEDGKVIPVDEDTAQILGGTPVGGLAAHMGPIARQMLGRPGSAFGMTPLLIFRNVSG